MKLAIMQPYLFPYTGYFNLVAQVDKFVFYDDVNFIKNGWINRNRLFLSGDVRYFTVPLSGGSPNLKIAEVKCQSQGAWSRKILESIKQSYGKAPHFNSTFDLIKEVLETNPESIAILAKRSVQMIAERLGYSTIFEQTSKIYDNSALSGMSRVIDICVKESAHTYINLPGGKDLYDPQAFKANSIDLVFSRPGFLAYQQFDRIFQPGLSILDVMMFNDLTACREIIAQEVA
ncbi:MULTISPECIES: WbqC family protein [Pseudomonas]|uniref:WbqC family protein n=1 Tax=Pseudomonas TaxID=286 RepID=UPI000E2792D9